MLDLYADDCFMGLGTCGAKCTGLPVDSNDQDGSGNWALPATMTCRRAS